MQQGCIIAVHHRLEHRAGCPGIARCEKMGGLSRSAWHNRPMQWRVQHHFIAGLLALCAGPSPLATAAQPASTVRAEVQIGICAALPDVTKALRLRAPGPVTTTWLFDDAGLNLLQRGLRLRLRVDARGADLTLKVADQDCARIPAGAIPPAQGKCELDLHGTTMTGAVSLSQPLSRQHADLLVAGTMRVHDALSQAQRSYLRDVVGGEPLPAALQPLGPLAITTQRAADRSYVLDVTTLPGGEQYLEVTRKVAAAKAERTRHRLEQDLARAGVTLCADQAGQAAVKLRKLLPPPPSR